MSRFLVAVAAFALAAPAAAQTANPAFWEVVGVGGALRTVPADGSGVIDRPDAGEIVRNLGCRQSRGRRWCEVELVDRPGVKGWIGNNNLRVASQPGAGSAGDASPPPPGGDSPPPGGPAPGLAPGLVPGGAAGGDGGDARRP